MHSISELNNHIYLDACATTPMHKSVINEINRININYFGNPSSIHSHGIEAAKILEESRFTIAGKLGCSFEEVIFTSGATESIHLAIRGLANSLNKGRIIISSVEHPAVESAALLLEQDGWQVEYWPVDNKGNIRLDLIDSLLSKPTKLVSIIWGQNEIGSIQPVHLIGKECKDRNIIFHTDATQLLPHCLFNFNELPIDLISASLHKMQGPKGIGLLLCKQELKHKLKYIQRGSPQEFGIRSGTEPIPLIAGAAIAIKLIKKEIEFNKEKIIFPFTSVSKSTLDLKLRLTYLHQLRWLGNELNENRLPNHLSFILQDKDGNPLQSRRFVRELSNRGISISRGSACSVGSDRRSNVLKAIGLDYDLQEAAIRISLGPWIHYNQISQIPDIMEEALLSL